MKTQTPAESVQLIALEKLHVSEHNTRQPKPKEPDIKELARSLKAEQKTPILVRPHPSKKGHFEIAAGARRRVAAELAGLKALKAIVREYSDDAFEETILTENLQRTDPDPYAEALLIQRLIKRGLTTVGQLAAQLGKSETWAARRHRLASITPELLKAWGPRGKLYHFSADMMEALAALPPDTQRAVAQAMPWQISNADSRSDLEDALLHYMHSLKEASWLNDPKTFIKGCGPGCACDSSKEGKLFDFDKGKDSCGHCLNPSCFRSRLQLHLDAEYDRLCNGEDLPIIPADSLTIKGKEYRQDHVAWQLSAKPAKGSKKVVTFRHGKLAIAYVPPARKSAQGSAADQPAAKSPAEREKARKAMLQGKRWTRVREALVAALEEAPLAKLTAPIDHLIAVFGLPFKEESLSSRPCDEGLWDYIKNPTAFPIREPNAYGRMEFSEDAPTREEALWPAVKVILKGLIPPPHRVSDADNFAETYRNIAKLIGFPITLHKRKADLEILPPKSWGKVDPHTLEKIHDPSPEKPSRPNTKPAGTAVTAGAA